MSDKGSVFQKGGGGTNFEQAIQTAFLITLIIRGNAPLGIANEIVEVAFQTTNRGYETDDLLVTAKSAIGQHRLLVQIKHNITFTTGNDVFKEVISAFWTDYNAQIFDRAKDKLLIIKSGFTHDERNHLKSLLNWAKTHATEIDFLTEVSRIKGKKDRLDVFKEILRELNNDIALTDKEIWEFLKCLDVLEYDFTNQNSVDEIYFLNLIKLCKNQESSSNEKEIWDTIYSFVSKLNKDGGSVTIESIQNEELYKNFDTEKLSPYIKAIDKLRKDSNVILSPLKNTISGFHLERKNIRQSIVDSLNNFQFTIVVGKPGVGKSAEIKDVLKNEFPNASVFVFRADQFNEPHIAKVFSSQGVNETIQDIFSCISLITDKIIFIDSLEKLLEADPECAFKQLLALLKDFPDIKIISSSRKYAVDLITLKFGIDNSVLGIAEAFPLDNEELAVIAKEFPVLRGILNNEKIKKLLQSPKYLDFAILALNKSEDDFSNISHTEFKDKLWNSLVVDSTNRKNGLPLKRENAFMEIAVNRTKEMKLFTRPRKADSEAIILLENDEMLFQENEDRRYSPTHDILEDWALVKYVSSKYEEHSNPKELFDNLGNEPAIRRAFRLWIEEYLIDDSKKINDLIRATSKLPTIERYWADEILIAVLKSDNCSSFFSAFEGLLLEDKNHFHFLNRCIHLLRTACKESNQQKGLSMLLPVGSGWPHMLLFIRKHILELDTLRMSICNLLSDWNSRIMFQRGQVDDKEILVVKEIIVHFLEQIESGDQFWQQEFLTEKTKKLVAVLYQLAKFSEAEIVALIDRAFNKKDRTSWRLTSFYESVIKKCISGLGTHVLTKELPKVVVDTAWREWKLNIKNDPEPRMGGERLDGDECWGIVDRFSFFPSGIYKTPIYNLLWNQPIVGLQFLTDFINYSVDFYLKAACNHKHEFIEVELELLDGKKVKQWASWELWAAYRGSSVTHYAIESMLMSLEKYLLETAEVKSATSRLNLKFMFSYLLEHSNNVTIAGVLASVAIAYPGEVEDAMLPLLSVKEFYEWDSTRALQESYTLAPLDNQISFAQEERIKMNKLPHRKKYLRGFSDFIIDYQFNIRKLNKEIHKYFDILQAKVNSDDILLKKRLSEIDIRTWEVRESDGNAGHLIVEPKYEQDVNAYMNSNRDYFASQSKSLNHSGLISKVYEGKEAFSYEKWKELHSYYSEGENSEPLYDRPVSLAVIGFRDFIGYLSKKQLKWCIKTIQSTIEIILADTLNRNFGLNQSFNLMEKEIALKSLHYLFAHSDSKKQTTWLIGLVIRILIAPFNDHEFEKIIEYVNKVLFKNYPNEGKRIWLSLIRYSEFRKKNPYLNNRFNPETLNNIKRKERKFIEMTSAEVNFFIDIPVLNFDKNEPYILTRAFIITPLISDEQSYLDFIKHFIKLLLNDFKMEKNYSFKSGGRQMEFQGIFAAQIYLRDLLLYADPELSKSILDLILNPAYQDDITHTSRKIDLLDFSSKILEYMVYKLDSTIADSTDDEIKNRLKENFWVIWEYLFNKIRSSGILYFSSILFLDLQWKKEASHWEILENKNELYREIVKDLGETNTKSIVNFFSTIGEKTFLPEGIDWLVEIFKTHSDTTRSLNGPSAERLIQRLYYNHISKIKNNKKLVENFVWILDTMVDFGSSEAYMFRENVITYKSFN